MVKNIFKIIFIIMFIFTLNGCGNFQQTGERIVAPKPNKTLATGTWKVEKYLLIDKRIAEEKDGEKLIDEEIYFSNDFAKIGDICFTIPKYNLKVVNSRCYFLYEYKIDTDRLGISNKEVNIILVSDSNNGCCELILEDNDSGYLYYNGILFKVKKTSETVNKLEHKTNENNIKNSVKIINDMYDSPTGIYLGLKTDREKKEDGNYTEPIYRTFWIYFSDGKLNEIKERENILIPRIKGFYELKVDDVNSSEQNIYERTVAIEKKDNKKEIKENNIVNKNSNHYEDIMFVGNDYVSLECYSGKDFKNRCSQYKMLPIDNLQADKGIDIGTLLGPEAKKAFDSSFEVQKNLLKEDNNKKISDIKLNYENYTMLRRNGHWALSGKAIDSKCNYETFNIEYLPPKKLINYDRLCVNWSTIKDIIPSAIDAYTSPNARIIIILNKSYIYLYEIINGKIKGQPLTKIKLNNSETVVMAEWANGDFVDKWNKFFITDR